MKRKYMALAMALMITTQLLSGCASVNNAKSKENVNNFDSFMDNLSKDKASQNFIKSNQEPIYTNNLDAPKLEFLNKYLDNYEVFLTGEEHGYTVDMPLEVKFLKYFVQNAGIKYFIPEITHSEGWLYNKYLTTGDDSLLRQLADGWDNNSLKYTKYDAAWKEIRNFYLSLDKDKRFKVIGLDVETIPPSAVKCMNIMMTDKSIPATLPLLKELRENVNNNKFNSFDTNKDNPIYQFSIELKTDMEKNEKDYREFLGEDFSDFKMICDGLVAGFNAFIESDKNPKDIKFYEVREKQIIKNFMYINSIVPKGKYYGQWGSAHVCTNKLIFDNFATAINNSNTYLKNKVYSIGYVFKGDTDLSNMYFLMDKYSQSKEPVVFFNFSGNDSPINKLTAKNALEQSAKVPDKMKICDYYKGWVMIKDTNVIRKDQ